MKKSAGVLIIIVSSLALIVISTAVLFSRKKSTGSAPPPIQIFSPTPTIIPSIDIPPELESEKIKQENYARNRGEYLQAHPWLLKLPLKAGNYFISYNSSDTFIVELYYTENSSLTKEQQLAQAKQGALDALTSIGIDASEQNIEYLQLLKK